MTAALSLRWGTLFPTAHSGVEQAGGTRPSVGKAQDGLSWPGLAGREHTGTGSAHPETCWDFRRSWNQWPKCVLCHWLCLHVSAKWEFTLQGAPFLPPSHTSQETCL